MFVWIFLNEHKEEARASRTGTEHLNPSPTSVRPMEVVGITLERAHRGWYGRGICGVLDGMDEGKHGGLLGGPPR